MSDRPSRKVMADEGLHRDAVRRRYLHEPLRALFGLRMPSELKERLDRDHFSLDRAHTRKLLRVLLGTDLGFEKFVDIKCRHSGLRPAAAVIVATVRALKMHSGKYRIVAGRPLDPKLGDQDLDAVEAGLPNLEKHIENVTQHGGLPAVVCVNRFSYDSDAEIELVQERALAAGASACEVSEVWELGGAGGEALARAVVKASEQSNDRPSQNE